MCNLAHLIKMADTLKIGKNEHLIPGIALPEAFRALDKHFESALQLCSVNNVSDGPLLGLVTVCQEMQTLLKLAFIENGLLASRIDLLTRYENESSKKTSKMVSRVEMEHKVTKKQIKRLRRKLTKYETIQRRKSENWWDVKVQASDYDTFSYLSRGSGYPDLEFMLRINQILIDFVKDKDRQELMLPPMGNDERAEVSKLASIYKLRCRYGKSSNLATSTLIKARQTTIPNPGEVDTVLDTFARTHKKADSEAKPETREPTPSKGSCDGSGNEGSATPKSTSPPVIDSTMITPLSSLTSPTIDLTINLGSPLTLASVKPPDPKPSKPDPVKVEPPKPVESTPLIVRDPRLQVGATSQSTLNLLQYTQLAASRAISLTNSPGSANVSGSGKSLLTGAGGLLLPQAQPKASPAGKREASSKDPGASVTKKPRLTRKSANGEQ